MHRWWFNIRCTYSRWWYFAKHEESWCSWVTVTKDNIKELLQSYIFFSSDGEATASLHKVQVIKISVLDVEIFELNLIRYSWLFHNFILSLHRENRERRIGIDRVKDAVEKCLQQVAESFFFFFCRVLQIIDLRAPCDSWQIFSWTWSKPWLKPPRNDERNHAWKKTAICIRNTTQSLTIRQPCGIL